jgi:hypothetical protein
MFSDGLTDYQIQAQSNYAARTLDTYPTCHAFVVCLVQIAALLVIYQLPTKEIYSLSRMDNKEIQ